MSVVLVQEDFSKPVCIWFPVPTTILWWCHRKLDYQSCKIVHCFDSDPNWYSIASKKHIFYVNSMEWMATA